MQHLEVSGAVRPVYGSLGVKGLRRLKLCGHIGVIIRTSIKITVLTWLFFNILNIDPRKMQCYHIKIVLGKGRTLLSFST